MPIYLSVYYPLEVWNDVHMASTISCPGSFLRGQKCVDYVCVCVCVIGDGECEGQTSVVWYRAGIHSTGPGWPPIRLAKERLSRTTGPILLCGGVPAGVRKTGGSMAVVE